MQTIFGKSGDFAPELENAIAAYRHKIFIERLGWPLPVENGMERDQFDHPDTLYVVAREDNGAICGCARLLPTTAPYLLSEIFPHLVAGAPIPSSPDVWELSRFAAASIDPNSTVDAAVNTRNLLAAAVKSAAEQGAKRLITVSPLGIERLLHRMGVHAHRAGPPSLADGKPIFACLIEIDEQTMDALGIASVDSPPAHPEYGTHGSQENDGNRINVHASVAKRREQEIVC
jgi:N-acyl-L-homoserine lactone synthetase